MVSALLVMPMILFFNISEITTVAAIVMLLVQGSTHIAHLKLLDATKAKRWVIVLAIVLMFSVAGLTLYSTFESMPQILYYLGGIFALALSVELILRLFNQRAIKTQASQSSTDV